MPRVTFEGLEDTVLPGRRVPGDYLVEATRWEETSSSRTGRSGYTIFCTVLEGPPLDNGEPAESLDYPIRFSIWLPMPGDEKKTLDGMKINTKKAFEGFGAPYDNEGFDPEDFLTRTAILTMVPQKDNDRYLEVKNFQPA